MNHRCLILIDGSNFYFKLKDLRLHKLLSFDFTKLTRLLSHDASDVQITYYVGRIRQDGSLKTKRLFDSQQKLLGNLKKHRVNYSLGYLLKSDDAYHEKGVDVQIATDMLVAAYEDSHDRIILVSSDTDLAPAIKKARQKGKIVEYVGFSHKPSVAMVSYCSESRLLSKDDILALISIETK